MTIHHNKYTSPALTQKVFANMRRVSKGFSGNETPLFDTVLVQPQTQADEDVEMPINEEQPATTSAPSTSEPQDQPSIPHDSLMIKTYTLSYHMIYLSHCLQRKVDALEKDKLAQAIEILSLKKRVEKLEKRRKGVIFDIDAHAEISLVDETQRLDDDLIFDTTADLSVSVAEPIVTIVSSLVTTDSVTITAVEPIITTTKPKAKGITIQEPSVTQKIAVSFISSFKGKAIMIESKKPVKIKDQIAHDEQVAKDLHDKIQVELEEEVKRQEEASMAIIAELYDTVQAQIYADQELATIMTLEEHEKFTHAQLKNRDFEEIQGLYNKEKELTDADLKEEEQLKTFLSIVPNEEEAINYEVLDRRYQIVDWKSEFYHDDRYGEPHDYYRVFRADGSSRYIKTFTEMVQGLIGWDFIEKVTTSKKTLEKMLVLRLTAESESEAAFDLLRTVASESTNLKPRSTIRKLYEHVSKTRNWWYPKFTPSGYKWKPKFPIGNVNTNLIEIILFIVDSGCSKHMMGNLKLLTNFVEKFLGMVKFGNDQIALILGYGDLVQGNITIKRAYYVERLNNNLFSVGQFCDADLEVAFRKSTCHVCDLKGNDLLTAKATSSQAWLWHRRLSYLNFDSINLLLKNDITCSRLHAQVRIVRTDKGMKFLNKTLHAYFAQEGIEHQTSTARTPEQNGIVERRNRTLVEVARTTLSVAKVPLHFWAEAIITTCFTQNYSLIIPRHEKTPYHIINGRKSSVKFFHIFGSLCYIVRDGENLNKMKEKGDACIFVGYSTKSRVYRVYNQRTRVIVETIHVNFDELPLMASDHVSFDPVPQCPTTTLEHDN
ncbi:retrovirus-related pol polyprotein from transposon TNT 1-94 [Tanacetum coccineum]|uniref:Retrovirus-related pol polyprotein from transposon TNT 1-94 n=1 Tax=Tanacetum coccineum TaxID=301880 RepID=A0ABQ4ZYA9_9ASTR